MNATPLPARFGLDPSPARDFVLHVTALQQRLLRALNVIKPIGNEPVESVHAVSEAIDDALDFKVGGDPMAVLAKQVLRDLRVVADTGLIQSRAAAATPAVDVDELAQEIRRVDGAHALGAGALAEALAPYMAQQIARHVAAAREEVVPARSAPVETKTLIDALYRAVAATRGHRDAMFKSDGDVIEHFLRNGASTWWSVEGGFAVAPSDSAVPKPSEMTAFHEALHGGRGELDAWLECQSEAEVRAYVIAYAAQRFPTLARPAGGAGAA